MPHTRKPASPQTVFDRARQLRRHPTPTEQTLWQRLRKRQLGAKFRRQVAIGTFIVDFFCREAGLVIEIDGDPHEEGPQAEHDKARTEWLEDHGFRVLRFKNDEVEQKIQGVIDAIGEKLPLPRSAGEGEG
jgi:very-short-patch-repair endonuclease